MNPADAIEAMPFAQAMRDIAWLHPAVRIAHIAGFTILVGSIAMFDLRVLGLSKAISMRALGRHLLPWTFAALVVIIPTGLMMFSAHATDLLASEVFKLKMGLLLVAGMNGAFFQTGPYATVKAWDTNAAAPVAARLSAAASLLLWLAILSCGALLGER